MKTTFLSIHVWDLHVLNIKEHPTKILKECGITYKKCVPQPIADCHNFYGVENQNNVTEYKGLKFKFEDIEDD